MPSLIHRRDEPGGRIKRFGRNWEIFKFRYAFPWLVYEQVFSLLGVSMFFFGEQG